MSGMPVVREFPARGPRRTVGRGENLLDSGLCLEFEESHQPQSYSKDAWVERRIAQQGSLGDRSVSVGGAT